MTPITKRPLFYWILSRYRGVQLLLLLVIVTSLFFRVFPLEMQKRIINIAISLRDVDLLFLYCGLYIGAVTVAGLLKYLINMMQTWIGQKILVEMRHELYSHILRLPIQFFRKTQAGTVVSAMTAELNSIGFFLGGALAIPVTSVLTFVTFLGFMIYLNPALGIMTVLIYPLEFILIPYLQSRYNRLNKERVSTTRAMANVVNEAVHGIHEVHGHGSFALENQKLDHFIDNLFRLLNKLFLVKYGIKFSNNLFQSLGPFLLFLVGGYFAIKGEFTIGALLAFLSAYEKVYDPWKEMIEYYQSYQDAKVRYSQIMETFDTPLTNRLAPPEGKAVLSLKGAIEARSVGYTLEHSIRLLEEVSFQLTPGQHLALVGFSGSGKSTLSYLIAQLYGYSEGTITIDANEVEEMTKLDISSNISFVAQNPVLFTGTVRENLIYPCKALEAASGKDSSYELPDKHAIIEMIKIVGLEDDVIGWGLRSILPRDKIYRYLDRFLRMRKIIQTDLKEEFTRAVEFYDGARFLFYSSIGVNIIFGDYKNKNDSRLLVENKLFSSFLKNHGLEEELIELGRKLAKATIDLLGDIEVDDFLFKGSPMKPEDLSLFKSLLADGEGKHRHNEQEVRTCFLSLALDFIPGRHKILSTTPEFNEKILTARRHFLQEILATDIATCTLIAEPIADEKQAADFTPYCANSYLNNHPVVDNILFGTVFDKELLANQLSRLAMDQFARHGLLADIMEIGLDFHAGSKGDRLSGGQRQKIALARAFLKKSPILILDEATASLDNHSQARIQRYIEHSLKGNTTVIAVIHRLDMVSDYDKIILLKAGKVIETGNYESLMAAKGPFYKLFTQTLTQ